MGDWRNNLLEWYESNKRDLPWRNITDPYKIWLSEVILQQTRVNQGWQYYLRFIEKFPAVKHLAKAKESEVLKLWQGLGYYSRARNLHVAANQIMKEFKGKFPNKYEDILKLKGVGEYTAGAISSIAFNLPHPAVDGNVIRVYSRILGIKTPVDSTKGKKEIMKAANELILPKTPRIYNQAVMELGALVCLPSNPDCLNCPVAGSCYALAHKLTQTLPVKQNKTKVRERFLNYLVITHEDKLLIRHRRNNDIWKGLYDFPCIEEKSLLSPSKIVKNKEWIRLFKDLKPHVTSASKDHIHILSHQRLHARFINIKVNKKLVHIPSDCLWINTKEIENYAIPKLIEKYFSI